MLQILRAKVEDAEEILTLQKEAYKAEAELYNNFDIQPLKETLEEIKEQFKTHVFLKAVYRSKIVGTVRACEKDGTCFIGKLAVKSDLQNNGIGTFLIKEIEAQFEPKRFELFTGAKSEKNLYLYDKLGYTVFKKCPDGCNGIEIVYLEKNYE